MQIDAGEGVGAGLEDLHSVEEETSWQSVGAVRVSGERPDMSKEDVSPERRC